MRLTARSMLVSCAIVGAATFAIWPLRPAKLPESVIDQAPSRTKQLAALDLAAFRAPIWIAEPLPPPPAAAAPAPPPPPPLKLQLLAIIREDGQGTFKAAVYDPDTDRIVIVGAGEKVGSRTVEQVNLASLTLRDDSGRRELALKEGGGP